MNEALRKTLKLQNVYTKNIAKLESSMLEENRDMFELFECLHKSGYAQDNIICKDFMFAITRKLDVVSRKAGVKQWTNYQARFVYRFTNNGWDFDILEEKSDHTPWLVYNATNTSKEIKYKQHSWREICELLCGRFAGICANIDCQQAATVGAHLYTLDEGKKYADRTVMAPICDACNKISPTLPFKLRKDQCVIIFKKGNLTQHAMCDQIATEIDEGFGDEEM